MNKIYTLKGHRYLFKIILERDYGDMKDWQIVVTDVPGESVGNFHFNEWIDEEQGSGIDVSSARVEDNHRRRGIATSAYCLIEDYLGKRLNRHTNKSFQTKDAVELWNSKKRKFGN